MKILVTGANGQLGRAFARMAEYTCHNIVCLNRSCADVTDYISLEKVVFRFRPDAVIHLAAFTAVDAAETQSDIAYAVNALGTRNVASLCLQYNAKMVYVSTDYVFDGNGSRPYTEFDAVNPLNIYGKSKLEGEILAARICPKLFIVRTSWLYGDGANFVRTILHLAREKDHLSVVNDQTGTPTYTIDLAASIMRIVESDAYGTYHMSNKGSCTWFEFAKEILRKTGVDIPIYPVSTTEFPRPARRPSYSVLRNYVLELSIGDCFRNWEDALSEYLDNCRD